MLLVVERQHATTFGTDLYHFCGSKLKNYGKLYFRILDRNSTIVWVYLIPKSIVERKQVSYANDQLDLKVTIHW